MLEAVDTAAGSPINTADFLLNQMAKFKEEALAQVAEDLKDANQEKKTSAIVNAFNEPVLLALEQFEADDLLSVLLTLDMPQLQNLESYKLIQGMIELYSTLIQEDSVDPAAGPVAVAPAAATSSAPSGAYTTPPTSVASSAPALSEESLKVLDAFQSGFEAMVEAKAEGSTSDAPAAGESKTSGSAPAPETLAMAEPIALPSAEVSASVKIAEIQSAVGTLIDTVVDKLDSDKLLSGASVALDDAEKFLMLSVFLPDEMALMPAPILKSLLPSVVSGLVGMLSARKESVVAGIAAGVPNAIRAGKVGQVDEVLEAVLSVTKNIDAILEAAYAGNLDTLTSMEDVQLVVDILKS